MHNQWCHCNTHIIITVTLYAVACRGSSAATFRRRFHAAFGRSSPSRADALDPVPSTSTLSRRRSSVYPGISIYSVFMSNFDTLIRKIDTFEMVSIAFASILVERSTVRKSKQIQLRNRLISLN